MGARLVLTALVMVPLAAAPGAAENRGTLTRAVLEFTVAVEGLHGDEGPRVLAALDAMTQALADWDRGLEADRAEVAQAEAAGASSQRAAHMYADLGAALRTRGRIDEAEAAFARAVALDPQLVTPHLLRGLLHLSNDPHEAVRSLHRAAALDPDDAAVAYWLVQAAVAVGDVDSVHDAVEPLVAAYRRQLARAEPRRVPSPWRGLFQDEHDAAVFPLVRYAEGYAHLAAGRLDQAIDSLRRAAAGDPLVGDEALRSDAMQRGIGALERGDVAGALAFVTAALDRAPHSSEAHRVMAVATRAAGRLDDTLAHLETAVALEPLNERAWVALVSVLRVSARGPQLEDVLRRALHALPASGRLRWIYADLLAIWERTHDTISQLEAVPTGSMIAGRGHVWGILGQFYLVAMRVDAAVHVFRKNAFTGSNNPSAQILLGNVYRDEGAALAALASFVAAVRIAPDLPAAHTGIGHVFLATDRIDDAVAAFRHALALSPQQAEAHYGLASALQRLKHSQAAAAHLEEYQRLQHAEVERRRQQVETQALRREATLHSDAGRHDEAVAAWRRVIDRAPDVLEHRFALADALRRAGRLADAVQVLETAAVRDGMPLVYLGLSELYHLNGETEASNEARREYLRRQAAALQQRPSP